MLDSDPRLMSIFADALERTDPAERAAYLDDACKDDVDLRQRVEALLAAHAGAGRFLEPDATGRVEPTSPQPRDETAAHASWTPPGTEPFPGGPGRDANVTTIAGTPPAGSRGGFVPGRVIAGRYTLLEVLGEGGMGAVYRADQSQPVKRQVALKLIRSGMDSRTVLARFDAERQALALMDHPNIARVYDGGATEAGQPFFVMELVDGLAITEYCDRHRLPIRARLELFVSVCQAVQHAHQKGIIHRDLKPSNVMVTEVDGRPTPKVIDFGVAKATEFDLTDQSVGDTGAIVGTPTYMSPEQADPSSMDIDTRTDVYALGVILYELLAGSPPLDAGQLRRGAFLEMLRKVREVDPPRPSTKVGASEDLANIAASRGNDPAHLKRELREDLDWIVMKALEKDRTRRYETANGFAVDILRHLANEPVVAAPPSRAYRLRKFVRKHRTGMFAASLVLLALLTGIAGTTLGLLEARRQEAEARRQARIARGETLEKEKARKAEAERAQGERLAKQKAQVAAEEEKKAKETSQAVLDFVEKKILAAARPKDQEGGLGYRVTLADAIEAALPAIEGGFPDKPLVEASLRGTIGFSFYCLGKPAIAAGQNEAALALYRRELGPDHPETLRSMNKLAITYDDMGRRPEALKLREEVLALQKARLGPDHPDTLSSMNDLARCYDTLDRRAEALKLRKEALALRKAALGLVQPDKLASTRDLADSYDALGRRAEALKLREETLALSKARLGPDHPDTLSSMNDLARSYFELHRHAEALKLGEEALALSKARLGPDHPSTLVSMDNVANSYYALGRRAEALKLREETLALSKARLGPDHPSTLLNMRNLTQSYLVAGRPREALLLLEEWSAANPKDTEESLKVAALQAWFGQEKALAATRRRVLAHARGTDDAYTAERAAKACSILPSADKAEIEAALGLARRAVELGKGSSSLHYPLLSLGMAEYRAGDANAADEALLAAAKAGSNDPRVTGTAAFYRALSLSRRGKADEARELAVAAAGTMKPLPSDEKDPLTGGVNQDDLILWLAYKEARTLLKIEPSLIEWLEQVRNHGVEEKGVDRKTGKPDSALPLLEQRLKLSKAKLGPEHLLTISMMDDLASAYRSAGKLDLALPLLEETLKLGRVKLGPDHPETLRRISDLIEIDLAAGRTREAVPLLEEFSAAHPQDTMLSLKVAALQAWFGQEKALAATRRRVLAHARGTDDPSTAERAARVCSILPSADNAEIEAAVGLARGAVEHGKGSPWTSWYLLSLGMAEYRAGDVAAADEALLAAAKAVPNDPRVTGTAAFYRALSLSRRGKADEARELVVAAAATLKPLPADDKDLLAGGADHDDLGMWLAYKEARTLLKIESPFLEEGQKLRKAGPGPDRPETLAGMRSLASAYQASGRTRDAVPLLAAMYAAAPGDTELAQTVAALQAWFGLGVGYGETCSRALEFARDTTDPSIMERTAKLCSLLPSGEKSRRESALALARAAVKLGEKHKWLPYFQSALGIAEYRLGDFVEAEAALRSSLKCDNLDQCVIHISSFYMAMSLFRQGKEDEARMLASGAAAGMNPLPEDEKNPLARGRGQIDLTIWLAYKEAKALIQFDAPPGAPATRDAK